MLTRIYADTSAVAKLFIAEKESPGLRKWLMAQPTPQLVSSALLGVELFRLLGLARPAALGDAERFLGADIDIVEITPPILTDAARAAPPRLRTLDAIHLATALDLGPTVGIMLTYDKLLAEAARAAGMATFSPGAA